MTTHVNPGRKVESVSASSRIRQTIKTIAATTSVRELLWNTHKIGKEYFVFHAITSSIYDARLYDYPSTTMIKIRWSS